MLSRTHINIMAAVEMFRQMKKSLVLVPRTCIKRVFNVKRHISHYSVPYYFIRSSPFTEPRIIQTFILSRCESRCLRTSSASCGRKVVPFLLADIGEGIKEAQITHWFVKEGDEVEQFQQICELKSDKATTDITSRYDGTIAKIHYAVDEYAQVGKSLVDIELNEDSSSTMAQEDIADQDVSSQKLGDMPASPAVRKLAVENNISLADVDGTGKGGQVLKEDILQLLSQQKSRVTPDNIRDDTRDYSSSDSDADVSPSSARAIATPTVRKLAREHEVKLEKVQGSGRDGRVLKDDVLAYLKYWDDTLDDAATPSVTPRTAPATPVTQRPTAAPQVIGSDSTEIIRGVRKVMVKSMTMSQKIPHFGYSDEVDVTALVKLRRQLREVAAQRGVAFSYMPVFVKAISLALLQYPILNSITDENCENITYKASHNIGVAMDTPAGLIVPNIKDVQRLSIFEVAEELIRLQSLTASGKFSTEDLSNGTFTFSNIGSIGGTYMKPVILFPQVAIGSIGRIQDLPRFDATGNVTRAHILHVAWSGDHRIIDGATMARFSNLWKTYVENPSMMILDLK